MNRLQRFVGQDLEKWRRIEAGGAGTDAAALLLKQTADVRRYGGLGW